MPSALGLEDSVEVVLLSKADEEERAAWDLAQAHSAAHGAPGGLQQAGACPRCGDRLKYIARQPRLGFVVWCDRAGCVCVAEREES